MIYGIRTGYFDVVAHPDRISEDVGNGQRDAITLHAKLE